MLVVLESAPCDIHEFYIQYFILIVSGRRQKNMDLPSRDSLVDDTNVVGRDLDLVTLCCLKIWTVLTVGGEN